MEQFTYSQKTVRVCGLTFRNIKNAESYASRVFADTIGTFGPQSPKTVRALREWGKVQRILATAKRL